MKSEYLVLCSSLVDDPHENFEVRDCLSVYICSLCKLPIANHATIICAVGMYNMNN